MFNGQISTQFPVQQLKTKTENEIVREANIATCKSIHKPQVSLTAKYFTITLCPALKLSNYQPCYALNQPSVTTAANISQKDVIHDRAMARKHQNKYSFLNCIWSYISKMENSLSKAHNLLWILQCVTLCY